MAGKNLTERDREVIWHPYTQMKTADPPIPIVRGEGPYLIDENGKKYLDAISSWWVNLHGHSHPYITEKVSKQLNILEHAIFSGFTHPPAVELAERLLSILPDNQKKIFYSDDGSTAVEVALKMCLQYKRNRGEPGHKILAFKNSYHGDTFGAMSVSARGAFTAPFNELLFDVEYIDTPNESNISELSLKLKAESTKLTAFIFEPLVQGSGGMLMYEAEYLDRLLRICKENNILAIADEVMTGFGRTGDLFAVNKLSCQPDVICLSKGLTGGTMALGVTSCTDDIYNAFLSDDRSKTFFHGHSFTGNPIACAAALASLDLLQMQETADSIQRICTQHANFREKIKGHSRLQDIRQTGTILALEWKTGVGTSYFSDLRDKLYRFFLDKGIILRPLGNIVYILPPYCISNEQLAYIYGKIEEALDRF